MKRFRPRFTLRRFMIAIAVVTVLTYYAGLPFWRYSKLPANTKAVLSAARGAVILPLSGPMPLTTLLKNLKAASAGPKNAGLPIFVDPVGLAEAKADLDAQITVSADRLMIKEHLDQSLKPLGLDWYVKDGLLMITSKKQVDLELNTDPEASRPWRMPWDKY